jgi:hypothetical protein
MSPNMARAALAFEDALVLAARLRNAGTVTHAMDGYVAQRSRGPAGSGPDLPP